LLPWRRLRNCRLFAFSSSFSLLVTSGTFRCKEDAILGRALLIMLMLYAACTPTLVSGASILGQPCACNAHTIIEKESGGSRNRMQ